MYLNNGSFKSEVDSHQFNLREKTDFQKLAGLWLAGEMINRIGIYGSKVAAGLSAFQRRSCYSIVLLLLCIVPGYIVFIQNLKVCGEFSYIW